MRADGGNGAVSYSSREQCAVSDAADSSSESPAASTAEADEEAVAPPWLSAFTAARRNPAQQESSSPAGQAPGSGAGISAAGQPAATELPGSLLASGSSTTASSGADDTLGSRSAANQLEQEAEVSTPRPPQQKQLLGPPQQAAAAPEVASADDSQAAGGGSDAAGSSGSSTGSPQAGGGAAGQSAKGQNAKEQRAARRLAEADRSWDALLLRFAESSLSKGGPLPSLQVPYRFADFWGICSCSHHFTSCWPGFTWDRGMSAESLQQAPLTLVMRRLQRPGFSAVCRYCIASPIWVGSQFFSRRCQTGAMACTSVRTLVSPCLLCVSPRHNCSCSFEAQLASFDVAW